MKPSQLYSLLLSFMVISSLTLYSKGIPDDSLYLGQPPPGNTQKIFPLFVTPGYSAVERIAFSSDGKKIYYSELNIDYNYVSTSARIKYYSYYNNKWNGPFILFEGYYSPSLSVDGNTMFFQTRNPREIWYSEKIDTGWSAPSKFMPNLALEGNLLQTNNGYYCATSNAIGGVGGRDLATLIITPTNTIVQSLGRPLNTTDNDNYLNMAKDESYAITYTLSGPVEGCALISYHKQDGSWTNPKRMGFGGWATTISLDNKYLFYSSIVGVNYATYWIRVDNIIDSLRHTNFPPYVKWVPASQTSTVGVPFHFTIPDSIFCDDDGNNTLTYTASLNNGSPLPSWISFDPVTRTFSGTPLASRPIPLSIKVIATDTARASVSSAFGLEITDPTGIEAMNGQLPKESQLFQNYPNPFNPSTTIHYTLAKSSFIKLNIYNLLGQKIRTIRNTFQTAGEYSLVWDATDERNTPVSSGLYFYRLEADNLTVQKKMLLVK